MNVEFAEELLSETACDMPDAVNVDSLGKHLRGQPLGFLWNSADFNETLLFHEAEVAEDLDRIREKILRKRATAADPVSYTHLTLPTSDLV